MILQALGLAKRFGNLEILRDLSLDLTQGETVAILGQSGSGKSTLLSLLAGLDRPSSGQVILDGQNIASMPEARLAALRGSRMGIVFQQFHLMSHLTALENVMLPLEIAGHNSPREVSLKALESVGLGHRINHFPHQLSGGEKQRVAIARAFVVNPKVLLADEPSGNLDGQTGDKVMDLLFDLVAARKMTMVLVTHNETLAKRCGRCLVLSNGALKPW